jgi:hypothetical protein
VSKILCSGIVSSGISSKIKIDDVTYANNKYTITGSGFITQSNYLYVLVDNIAYTPDIYTNTEILLTLHKRYGEFRVVNERMASNTFEYVNPNNIIFKFIGTSFNIPCSGKKNNADCIYNWRVFVDYEEIGTYIGTSSNTSTGISISNLADTEHIVEIIPTDGLYTVGWGVAFGFQNGTSGANNTVNKNKLSRVLSDPDFAHLYTETNTGNYFRSYQYSACANLTKAAQETMPSTVTTIGTYFRNYQYNGCVSLTTAPDENLPNTLTTIGSRFRSNQYKGCNSLTVAPEENLPTSVTTLADYFRSSQYTDCVNLSRVPNEQYFGGTISSGWDYRSHQYQNCPNIRVRDYVFNKQFATVIKYNSTYPYKEMFSLSTINTTPDDMPQYIKQDDTLAPVTELTPTADKNFVTNRTGIAGYDSLNANWK